MEKKCKKYDVVATNIKTGAQRVMQTGLTEANAEAVIKFAIMPRGVEEEFYGLKESVDGK